VKIAEILQGQVPCHLISCYGHVMLCYVMLCYVMLCYVMLCYVMGLYIWPARKCV